ncbi:MAG: hypothetical protein WA268_03430, partial [Xanthobacteraceae bacterium]
QFRAGARRVVAAGECTRLQFYSDQGAAEAAGLRSALELVGLCVWRQRKLQWQPWFTTDRTSALGDQMQAKFQGQSVGGRLEAGYRFGLPAANECRCRGFCWQP